jgi:hypothetical protein
MARGTGFLRVLTFFLVIVIPQILHTCLRLNITVIRRTCRLNVGTLRQKQWGIGQSYHFYSPPPPSCKTSAETAHCNHYHVCLVIQFCLNGNLVLNVFHKVENGLQWRVSVNEALSLRIS